ncbi:nucleotidyltransferase family protein [Zunongwangia sp. F260]|uniref:Nucleotidyltransferase family protein n=1 Tax=Autumnicola lenta TaxID=3075593 RepID=A0ABU3CL11_9FLAO|nr:nucleotidyltransferase family protein [Zunongwangia sp. F260]MDT0646645.1 nucleotidyltransferase family protein [Zunongwangia sp. F260]
MNTLAEIKSKLVKHRPVLFRKYAIKNLAIFGSYARNQQKEDSDLDIMVEFKENIGIKIIDLAEEIEDLVGFNIDLVSRNAIKERYLKHIEQDLIDV